MIMGIGVDICETERFERLAEDDHFIDRYFTPEESGYCRKIKRKAECFAARFAAKEAFVKAMGTGLSKGVFLKDIEVKKDDAGRPYLNITGETLATFNSLNGNEIFLSISHEKSAAVAFVVITKKT